VWGVHLLSLKVHPCARHLARVGGVGAGGGWVEYDGPVAFRGRGLARCWVLRRHP
jgi:hypothetical protein